MTQLQKYLIIICIALTIFPIARGSICIFYKARLPLRVLNISNLNECINFEVCLQNLLSHSSEQVIKPNTTPFQIFRSNHELCHDSLSSCNPFLTIIVGDFNAKSKQWCKIEKAVFQGSRLNFQHRSLVYHKQSLNLPTFWKAQGPKQIYYLSPSNMVMDSASLHASLYPHCHHQIILAKFDLKVFYPPPYERFGIFLK